MEVKVLVLCALLGSGSAKCLGNNCEDGRRSPEGSSRIADVSTISPDVLIRTESDSEGHQQGQHNSRLIFGSSTPRYGQTSTPGYGLGSNVGVGSSIGGFGNSRPAGYDYRVGGGSIQDDGYQGNRGGSNFPGGFINSINTDPYSNNINNINNRPSGGGGLFSGDYPGGRYPGTGDYPGGRYPGTGGYSDDGRGRYPSNSFGVSNTGYNNNLYPPNNNYGGYSYGDDGYDGYQPNFLPGGGNTVTFLPGSGYVRNGGGGGGGGGGALPGNIYFPQRNNDGFIPTGGIYTVPLGDTGRYPSYSNFNNRGFGSSNPAFVGGDSFGGNNFGGVASRYPNVYPANDNTRFFSGNNLGYPANTFAGGSRYPSGGIGFVDDNNPPVTNTGFLSPGINTGYLPPTVNTGYLPPTVSTGYLPPPGK